MLKFVDGFDHYPITNLGMKYNQVLQNLEPMSIVSPGRFGGSCVRNNLTYANFIRIVFPAQKRWIVGMAINITNFDNGPTSFITMSDAGIPQLTLCINAVGRIQVNRGDSRGTVLTTTIPNTIVVPPLGISTNPVPINTWFFLEMNGYIDATAGSVSVQISGSNWLNLTGINTRNTSNNPLTDTPLANTIQIGCDYGSPLNFTNYTYFDDLYICDGTGTTNNSFLGDCRVETLFPKGAGTTSWTPSAGANWQCVDDPQFDGDTSYVSSNTMGQIDTYTMTNLPSTPVKVFGMQHTYAAHKLDAGIRTVSSQIVSGVATPTVSAVPIYDTYVFTEVIAETDPNTGAAWTASAVNSVQTGIKLVS